MNPRLFVDVDPRELHLPTSRFCGADSVKLQRQIAGYGTTTAGMPILLVDRGSDGQLVLNDGVTRATRVAKLLPGHLVRVEVCEDLSFPVGHWPTVGDRLP